MKMATCIKYEIIDGQAYCEDGTLIYNLFAHGLPKDATVIKLTEHFKKFGDVSHVRLMGKGKSKKCFIYFPNPKTAAKFLQEKHHVFMDSIIRIEPCHSLRQPDGQIFIKALNKSLKKNSATETASYTSYKIEQDASILNLNDDCLEHICKHLLISDQINFAITCKRFCSIFMMVSKVEYGFFDTFFFNNWTLLKIRIFLQIVGSNIKDLEINYMYDYDDAFDNIKQNFISLFCINVERLKVAACPYVSSVRTLINKMEFLEELELVRTKINDRFIRHLKTHNHLKSLHIMNNAAVTGKNISFICGLKKLTLNKCLNLTPWNFRIICKKLNNLVYLDIGYCECLKSDDYEFILLHLPLLETLKISCTKENIDCLAQLANLKDLEIYRNISYTTLPEEFLQNVAYYQANQLETLKLVEGIDTIVKMDSTFIQLKALKVLYCDYNLLDNKAMIVFSHLPKLKEILLSNCQDMNDEVVFHLLESCLQLKRIEFKNCDRLSPNFLRNVLQLLKEQNACLLRNGCVHMALNDSHSYDYFSMRLPTENFSEVLKVNCDQHAYSGDELSDDFEFYFD